MVLNYARDITSCSDCSLYSESQYYSVNRATYEILNASEKVDIKTILSYTLEFDKDLITQRPA
jgi:hypothetical protein